LKKKCVYIGEGAAEGRQKRTSNACKSADIDKIHLICYNKEKKTVKCAQYIKKSQSAFGDRVSQWTVLSNAAHHREPSPVTLDDSKPIAFDYNQTSRDKLPFSQTNSAKQVLQGTVLRDTCGVAENCPL